MNDEEFVTQMKKVYPMGYTSLVQDFERSIKKEAAFNKTKAKKKS